MEQSEIDQMIMRPENLLNVKVEYGTIRDLLSELNNKIELLEGRIVDFLKMREIDQIQNQIDQINQRFDKMELESSETANPQIPNTDILLESMDRKIEDNRLRIDHEFRELVKSTFNELNEKINAVKDDINVDNATKYATIQMFATLQARIEEADSQIANLYSLSEKLSSRPRSPEKHSSRIASPKERSNPSSGKGNYDFNNRISIMAGNLETLRGQLDEMKKKIQELENENRQLTLSSDQLKGLKDSIDILKENYAKQSNEKFEPSNLVTTAQPANEIKSYVEPETIIKTIEKTIEKPVDVENLKFEVVKSVFEQVMPLIKENLEKFGNPPEKKQVTFSISDSLGISEEQPAISTTEPPTEESPKQQQQDATTTKARSRDFPSILVNHNSPRMNKSDPRMAAAEMQIKTLKERIEMLEKSMKNRFEQIDGKLYDLGIRTTSIEKHIESDGTQIVQHEANIYMESVACQTNENEETQVVSTIDVYTSPAASRHTTPRLIDSHGSHNSLEQSSKSNEQENITPRSNNSQIISYKEGDSDEENPVPRILALREDPLPNENQNSTPEQRPERRKIQSSDGIRPINPSRCLSGRANSQQIKIVSSPSNPKIPTESSATNLLQLNTSRSNLSARSHMTSQTYEELDAFTKQLDAQVRELIQQMANATERLGEEDRQIHHIKKELSDYATKDDLDELRSELEERNSFNKKNNPNSEAVTTTQLKRVVANFQGSIKNLDKQFESMKDLVPQFVSKEELTELVDAVTQLALQQSKENMTATAGGRLSYKCLLCGRPTNQVTGMITETEVARMIGEPPIIGAAGKQSNNEGNNNDFVLVYGKEGNAFRAASPLQSSKRKKTPTLPRITPKSPHPIASNAQMPTNSTNS